MAAKFLPRAAGKAQGTTDHHGTAEVGGMSRVLVVEDEAHLAQGLRFNLQAEGIFRRGRRAMARRPRTGCSKRKRISMPWCSTSCCRAKMVSAWSTDLRAARNYVPVLMLTARSRPEDVLKGFAAGADDYLPKPFDLSILLARLQGLLRRSAMDARRPMLRLGTLRRIESPC